MSYLSTSKRIFSIDFHGTAEHFIFDDTPETLGNLVQIHGKHGILSIKQYQTAKGVFKKLSVKEIENWFSWDTHSIEQLKKINYIKK
jgi:hypothetical protein